jgi:hypothetical protein
MVSRTGKRVGGLAASTAAGPEKSRRDALRSIVKFSAFVAPATMVLLDSQQAAAQGTGCSSSGNPKAC